MLGLIRIYLDQCRQFSDDELDFMLTVAEQCACIIERVQLMENQKEHFNHLATRYGQDVIPGPHGGRDRP